MILMNKQQVVMNVFEVEEDPVCDFCSCYHKFSIHGKRSHQKQFNCICKHPTNKALGVIKE